MGGGGWGCDLTECFREAYPASTRSFQAGARNPPSLPPCWPYVKGEERFTVKRTIRRKKSSREGGGKGYFDPSPDKEWNGCMPGGC
jgi:hypothetical protein